MKENEKRESTETLNYKCPFCRGERFIGHQLIRADVVVGQNGDFKENLPGGLEAHIYDAERPYGPFTCIECNAEFDELPILERIKLPRGTFTVLSGKAVERAKELGYGYSHEDNGYTVIGNGRRAFATLDREYNRVYDGKRSFML